MHTLLRAERQFTVEGFYTAFRLEKSGDFIFDGESHDFWECILITEGNAEITEDGNVYTLRENQLILHAPLEFHRIRSADRNPFDGYILSFQTTGTPPARLKDGVFQLSREESERYRNLCEAVMPLLSGHAAHRFSAQAAAAGLEAFLIELGSSASETRRSDSAGAAAYRRIVSQMSDAVCENLTLQELALRNGLSLSYLKQLFDKFAGVSPKQYYTHLRVRHAMQLLESGHSVSETADRMNFSSPAYFTDFFRKHTGRTPSAFRKRMEELP